MTRRAHLLSWLGLAACGPRMGGVEALPEGAVTLGWRWVPGQELGYRVVVEQVRGEVRVQRAEAWQYLVRGLDDHNVAQLEARLVGFGAGVRVDGEPVPEERVRDALVTERESARPVALSLSMDGHLLDCSERDFARSLPHRLLGLRLPRYAIRTHDEWADPELARPFSTLLPADLDVSVSGSSRLLELTPEPRGLTAALEIQGQVRTLPGGPRITLSGSASWDASAGRLARRELEARFAPGSGALPDPGLLHLRLEQL